MRRRDAGHRAHASMKRRVVAEARVARDVGEASVVRFEQLPEEVLGAEELRVGVWCEREVPLEVAEQIELARTDGLRDLR
jgi:hypothetical protein